MNLRLRSSDIRFILFIIAILLFTFSKSFAANISSAGSGNWNSTATWTGGVVPGINDDVTIAQNHAIVINTNATCNSITISDANSSATTTVISINSGFSLKITNGLSISPSLKGTNTISVGNETLTCGSLTFGDNNPNGISRISIGTGRLNVNGDITMSGNTATENQIVFSGAGQLAVSGIFNPATYTFTLANNCKVIFNGTSAQSIPIISYNKLQIEGTGTKTLAGNITVGTTAGDSLIIAEASILNSGLNTIAAGISGIIFQVNGSIITSNTSGLFGSASTTLLSTNTPTVNLGLNSIIEYNSTAAQSITSTTYATLTVSGNSTKTISSACSVSKELNVNAGTLATGGFLTLSSTATNTARLGLKPGTITGNIIVQRFIPGGSNKRKWRYLSSPVNTSASGIAISQFIDDILVTAPAGAAAGFDVNPNISSNPASLRTYTESVSGNANNGWTDPTNITNTIATGTGIEVFVRGTRNLANAYDQFTTPNDVTIDFVGTLNYGNYTVNLSYTNNNATTADGFNLVGNPYASAIDISSANFTKSSGITNFVWCYNPNTASYGVYNMSNGVAINGMTPYIASGQGFFLKATTTGASVTFTENMKTTLAGNNYFRSSSAPNMLSMVLSVDSNTSDETIISIDPASTNLCNDENDAVKFYNDALNIYSIAKDGGRLAINSIPSLNSLDTIKFCVWSYNGSNIRTGLHSLRFSGINNFNSNVFLNDNYLNSTIQVNDLDKYDFNITTDSASYGNNRFKLLFSNKTLGINNADIGSRITVFPNPATNTLYIGNTNNANVEVEVIDIFGRTMISKNSLVNRSIDISSIPSGNYFIKINDGENLITRRFIKE